MQNAETIFKLLSKASALKSVEDISEALGLPKGEVRNAVQELIRAKRVKRISGKFIVSRQGYGAHGEVTGRLSVSRDGYGFVETDGDDIFIPRANLNSALSGDLVTAAISKRRGRREGSVINIVGRALSEVACRVHKNGVALPYSKTFIPPVIIDDGYREGDIVFVRITSFPQNGGYLKGVVLEKLGAAGDKGIENLIVMKNYGLTRVFPKEAENCADSAAIEPVRIDKRADFRGLFTVTIDGEDAKDFDDAVSVEKSGEGYALYVHIADVSNYVKGGTPLDREAYKRGTSVYFPEFAIPMLPEILSNGICSLRPREDRYAVTVKIDYDLDGNRRGAKFYTSVINSSHRLTYGKVNEVLRNGLAGEKDELNLFIFRAAELSKIIGGRRKGDGALSFNLPEVKFTFSSLGDILSVEPAATGESERIIEHFMIEANEAAAEALLRCAPSGIFRNHLPPDPKKVLQWTKSAIYFGFDSGKLPKKPDNKTVQRWFSKIENHRFSYILKTSLVRSMQKAVYEGKNAGHFGLASSAYTHFTSPIRRYPDLFVHRLLKKYLFNIEENVDPAMCDVAAKHSSVTEREGDDAERDVQHFKKLAFLANSPERVYSAFISRVGDSIGVFIFELLMYGTLEATKDIGRKTLNIGDLLKVAWSRNDLDSCEAFFTMESLESSGIRRVRPSTSRGITPTKPLNFKRGRKRR